MLCCTLFHFTPEREVNVEPLCISWIRLISSPVFDSGSVLVFVRLNAALNRLRDPFITHSPQTLHKHSPSGVHEILMTHSVLQFTCTGGTDAHQTQ